MSKHSFVNFVKLVFHSYELVFIMSFEIQFIEISSETPMATQLKILASKVLFALSLNNFNAVFSRISSRLQELSNSSDESPDCVDIELIQHINVDLTRLIKLFTEVNHKFRALNKKGTQQILLLSLEKCIWNWMDTYPAEVCILTL